MFPVQTCHRNAFIQFSNDKLLLNYTGVLCPIYTVWYLCSEINWYLSLWQDQYETGMRPLDEICFSTSLMFFRFIAGAEVREKILERHLPILLRDERHTFIVGCRQRCGGDDGRRAAWRWHNGKHWRRWIDCRVANGNAAAAASAAGKHLGGEERKALKEWQTIVICQRKNLGQLPRVEADNLKCMKHTQKIYERCIEIKTKCLYIKGI